MAKNDELNERYMAAMHGVQSAIAFLLERGEQFATPKHLRVGINSCLVDTGAMVGLLIKKGIITEEEYFTVIAEGAEAELLALTERAKRVSGINNLSFA